VTGVPDRSVVVPDLDGVPGVGGAVWSLPHDGDLDANLIRLEPGGAIDGHVNVEVDVMMIVRGGSGALTVDGVTRELTNSSLALVRKGSRRSITAGSSGIEYLTVHRRRGPLTVAPSA